MDFLRRDFILSHAQTGSTRPCLSPTALCQGGAQISADHLWHSLGLKQAQMFAQLVSKQAGITGPINLHVAQRIDPVLDRDAHEGSSAQVSLNDRYCVQRTVAFQLIARCSRGTLPRLLGTRRARLRRASDSWQGWTCDNQRRHHRLRWSTIAQGIPSCLVPATPA
jgi:hypothetical protein